jgi:hypothetical protein
LAPSRARRNVELTLLLGGFALLFAYLPHGLVGDDFSRFDDVERLLHHGHLSDSPFSLVMPLVSSPLLLLGEVVRSPEWWAARFNTVVVGAGALVVYLLLRGRVDSGLLRRIFLVLLFASFLTNRLRDYNAEVFTSAFVALGLVLLVVKRRALFGWAAIVIGVVNTPATIVGAAAIAVAETWRTRRLRHLLGPAAAAALIVSEAWIRRGGPLSSGEEGYFGVKTVLTYSGQRGFSYPLVLGVLSILVSFGRGLVFFVPGIFLGLARTTRQLLGSYRWLVALMCLYVAALVLVYAKWWAWYGGLSWGPRFFVFAALPASIMIAVRIDSAGRSVLADVVTLVVLALSSWVAVTGAVADLADLNICTTNRLQHEAFCWYVPQYSSLWRPFVDFPELTRSKALVAGWCLLVFAYLAAPLVAALVRAVRAVEPAPAWGSGWRL